MNYIDLIKTVAPWIGTALGTPLGGMAISAACDVFGITEKTEENLKAAVVGASAEQMLALKVADQDFTFKMQELGFKQITDLEALAVKDRSSARDMNIATRSIMPAVLTCFVVSAFSLVLLSLFVRAIPIENKDITIYMIGQLSGGFAGCLAFWIGTTRESGRKTELIAAAPAIGDDK